MPHADAVTRRLQDTYTNVRQAALDALGEAFLQGEAFLGGQAAEQVMAVGRRLADSDWRVRVAALQLLGRLGAGARQHTTAVGGRLHDDDWRVRPAPQAPLWSSVWAGRVESLGSVLGLTYLGRGCLDCFWFGGPGFGVKEMMQPCLIHLHLISLVRGQVRAAAAVTVGLMGLHAASQVPTAVFTSRSIAMHRHVLCSMPLDARRDMRPWHTTMRTCRCLTVFAACADGTQPRTHP